MSGGPKRLAWSLLRPHQVTHMAWESGPLRTVFEKEQQRWAGGVCGQPGPVGMRSAVAASRYRSESTRGQPET